jgi:hypothetical protein
MPVASSTVRIESMKAAAGMQKIATIARMMALTMLAPSSLLTRFHTTP